MGKMSNKLYMPFFWLVARAKMSLGCACTIKLVKKLVLIIGEIIMAMLSTNVYL